MKSKILRLVLLLAVGWTLAWGQSNPAAVGFITKVGQAMPDFTVDMFDGSTVSTKDLRGKVILLNFWGAKCGGCLLEMKRFPEEIIKPYGAREDFFLLPVEAQGNDKATIESTAKRLEFNFPLAYENGKDIGGLFYNRVFGIPRTLIIDREGKIVYQAFAYSEDEFKKMLKVLDKTIKQKDELNL